MAKEMWLSNWPRYMLAFSSVLVSVLARQQLGSAESTLYKTRASGQQPEGLVTAVLTLGWNGAGGAVGRAAGRRT